MLTKNQLEVAELFKVVDFEPVEHWMDPPVPSPQCINLYLIFL